MVDVKVHVPRTEEVRIKFEEFLANRTEQQQADSQKEEDEEVEMTNKQKRDKLKRERYIFLCTHD
jgi:hypothetical protein